MKAWRFQAWRFQARVRVAPPPPPQEVEGVGGVRRLARRRGDERGQQVLVRRRGELIQRGRAQVRGLPRDVGLCRLLTSAKPMA